MYQRIDAKWRLKLIPFNERAPIEVVDPWNRADSASYLIGLGA